MPKCVSSENVGEAGLPRTPLFENMPNITAQGCIADAHSPPEVTEKMVVRGGVRPRAQPFFRDFFGTLRCNTNCKEE
jgi:hypothetical protein